MKMKLIEQIINAGKGRVDERMAYILQIDPLLHLEGYCWALAHQTSAAVQTPAVWEAGLGSRIEERLAQLIADGECSASEAPTCRIFDKQDCIPIWVKNYEESGYYTGLGVGRDLKEDLVFQSALDRITGFEDTRWLLPLLGTVVVTGKPSDIHVSSSQRDLPGTVITQAPYDIDHCAEVLVHEGSHTALNLALCGLDVEDKVLQSRERYYSPWKGTDRPAFGFLHAVYSFGRVELIREHLGLPASQVDHFRASLPSLELCIRNVGSHGLEAFFDEHTDAVLQSVSNR